MRACLLPSCQPENGTVLIAEPLCLIPNNYEKFGPVLTARTNRSIALRLVAWRPPGGCRSISLPTINYTLHYRSVLDDGADTVACDHTDAVNPCNEKVKTPSPLASIATCDRT